MRKFRLIMVIVATVVVIVVAFAVRILTVLHWHMNACLSLRRRLTRNNYVGMDLIRRLCVCRLEVKDLVFRTASSKAIRTVKVAVTNFVSVWFKVWWGMSSSSRVG